MNQFQENRVLEYLSYLKGVMYLNDWSLRLGKNPPKLKDAIAEVEPLEGRKVAYIRLFDGFFEMSEAEQTHSLVHELIHLHHIPATDIIRNDTAPALSQSTYDLLWSCFKRQMEYCVDGLADAFSKLVQEIHYNEGITDPPESPNV